MLKPGKYHNTKTYFDSRNLINDNNDDFSKILAMDYKTYLADDILVKVDRSSMSVALEGREPFLDHRIIEWVAQLPMNLKIRGKEKKYLLKNIAHRYIPEEMLRKPKMGFGIPMMIWFKDELIELINEFLSEDALRRNEFLNASYILRLKKKFLENPNEEEAHKMWLPLMFQMWWKRWMD